MVSTTCQKFSGFYSILFQYLERYTQKEHINFKLLLLSSLHTRTRERQGQKA